MELTTSSTVVEHPTHNLKVKGSNQYLINFDFLPVRIDRQGLSLEARAGLDLAYDDGAHVGVLVDDRHHEGAVEVTLQRWQRVDVRNERLLPKTNGSARKYLGRSAKVNHLSASKTTVSQLVNTFSNILFDQLEHTLVTQLVHTLVSHCIP